MFGVTGAGKSTLLNVFLDKNINDEKDCVFKIGYGLESCTLEPNELRAKIDGFQLHLLDLPGFEDNRSYGKFDVYATNAV